MIMSIFQSAVFGLYSKYASNRAYNRLRSGNGGCLVRADSVEKARWLRDLLRFLPLRSQFVLSGNTRDLQMHEAAPGQITSVTLSRALPDALKAAGFGRIASFDLLNGF